MASCAKPRSLARSRAPPVTHSPCPPVKFSPGAKTESIGSDEPAAPSSGYFNDDTFPKFDLEKTFPAILAPLSLLRKIPESRDLDALRALATVFAHCLDAILYSMQHLPDRVSTSPKYHLALSGVTFSKEMFMGHVNRIDPYAMNPVIEEAIEVALQFLDMTVSGLKGFLHAAAYEVAQLKPLPQVPADDQGELPMADDSAVFDLLPSVDCPIAVASGDTTSVESHHPPSNGHADAGRSTDSPKDSPTKPQRSLFSAFFKPLSLRGRGKKDASGPDSMGTDSAASSTLVNSDSDHSDHGGGYVHVSVNIRNSLAKFPVSVHGLPLKRIPHPEDDKELWKDRNGLAQLASLKALVRYMTTPDCDSDVEIVDVFFLCFRFFSSPKAAFDALVARYDEALPREVSLDPVKRQSHALQTKIRVARLLFLWVDLHWRAEEDAEVFTPLTQFAFSRLAQDIPREASSKLISSLHDRACAGDKSRGLRKEKTVARAEASCRSEVLTCTWEPCEKKAMMKGTFSKVKLQHFNFPGGHSMLALQLTVLLWEKYSAFEPEDAVRHLMIRNGDENAPTTEVAQKVATFMAYEKAVHRFVMHTIGTAESAEARAELVELFLDVASKCHELRNYSASCLIALACDRPSVLPFVTKLKLGPEHEQVKATLSEFYTQKNHHLEAYKQALQSCCCPALPGMMIFIREVARGCGSGPFDQHPAVPGSRLINLKRYRPITWAVRAMERCHAPFKIHRVDYVCNWLEHVLAPYLVGTEAEWEQRIYEECRKL